MLSRTDEKKIHLSYICQINEKKGCLWTRSDVQGTKSPVYEIYSLTVTEGQTQTRRNTEHIQPAFTLIFLIICLIIWSAHKIAKRAFF